MSGGHGQWALTVNVVLVAGEPVDEEALFATFQHRPLNEPGRHLALRVCVFFCFF